nr:transposase [Oceanospirillum maris]
MPCITPVFYKEAENLDLSAFHQPYKNDSEGRPAYDPAILLKIILFAYSKGITSSREIQWQLYCLVHNVEKLAKYGHLSQ